LFILKLFIILIIHQAEIERSTQASDQVIQFFAFFVFSSSQFAIKYIIQLSIRDITAIIATYCINVEINFHHTSPATLFIFFILSQGSHKSLGSNFFVSTAITLFISNNSIQIIVYKYFFILI
jgi:hypothetical protein